MSHLPEAEGAVAVAQRGSNCPLGWWLPEPVHSGGTCLDPAYLCLGPGNRARPGVLG